MCLDDEVIVWDYEERIDAGVDLVLQLCGELEIIFLKSFWGFMWGHNPGQMKLLFKIMSTKELDISSNVSCICQFNLHLFFMPGRLLGSFMIPFSVYLFFRDCIHFYYSFFIHLEKSRSLAKDVYTHQSIPGASKPAQLVWTLCLGNRGAVLP